VFSLAVLVAALGYFVDIYDLLLFSIIRIDSLKVLALAVMHCAMLAKNIKLADAWALTAA